MDKAIMMDNILGIIAIIVILAFCVAVIYAIVQIGRYFKKKADKQG